MGLMLKTNRIDYCEALQWTEGATNLVTLPEEGLRSAVVTDEPRTRPRVW